MAVTCVSNVAKNTEETRSDALGMFVVARAAFALFDLAILHLALSHSTDSTDSTRLFASSLRSVLLPLLHGPAVLRLVGIPTAKEYVLAMTSKTQKA